MKKIDLWQVVSTIANIGVIAGIIFLAYEPSQNTLAVQLSATDSYVAEMNEADYFIVADPEFAELLLKGVDGEQLTRAEQLRVKSMLERRYDSGRVPLIDTRTTR